VGNITPKSIVTLIVEMLQPYKGRVYDPAMGSGGFFVPVKSSLNNMHRKSITKHLNRKSIFRFTGKKAIQPLGNLLP
jgi:type I restriction-modification system DNA methylase subunit